MSRKPTTRPARPRLRTSSEIYCRRDNRVYDLCPYAAEGQPCPCVQGMETADALFEIGAPDAKPAEDRGSEDAPHWVK
ncbi:MAG TPA: hypothetical protein VLT84_12915 [Acidobacteriota bacterium]|nr:hypothetical protein [Acidobacteriota bacterium]